MLEFHSPPSFHSVVVSSLTERLTKLESRVLGEDTPSTQQPASQQVGDQEDDDDDDDDDDFDLFGEDDEDVSTPFK